MVAGAGFVLAGLSVVMPPAFPAGFRRDVIAVARKRAEPMAHIAKDCGHGTPATSSGQAHLVTELVLREQRDVSGERPGVPLLTSRIPVAFVVECLRDRG